MKPDVLYQTAKRKILDALPDILFFLFLFYAILVLFGVQYVIVVSFVTLLYKIRRKRKQTPRRLCIMFFVQMALSILAFLASHSLLACVLLNIAVPFLLVFLQSSQFNQKGYMASAMGFVFLQLRPIPYTDFMTYLLVMACSLGFAVCCLLLSSYGHRREDDYALARKGIALLQEQMDAYLKQKTDQQRKEELVNIQRLLYKQAYQSRGFTYIATKEGRLRYLFALLLQRSSYFLENMDNIPVCSEQQQVLLQRCMQFLKHVENFNCTDNSMLLEEGQKLFTACRKKQDAVSLFLHNFLQLFLQILKDLQDNKKEAVHREWKLPEERKLRNRLRMDSFEFRFASRLSLVLLCGFLFARLSKLDHSYWLVLNAFLLLQPMYEESAYRLKTRFIGTVFGCTVIYLVLPHFPGVAGHFLFASIVVSLMYCATPGTWIQAMFSTCFAITLTSLAMRETIAIEMRLTDSNLNHTGIYLYSKGKIMIHLTFDYKTDEKCTTPGQYLKYHRTFQGFTTRELAEKVGIVPATLVLYENDRHPIKHSTAVALANALGIDRNRLLDKYTAFVDYPYSSLLKKVRQELSLTQMQMAEVIGIGQTSYSGWEREIRVPRRKEYEKILAALKKLKVNVDTYLCHPAST